MPSRAVLATLLALTLAAAAPGRAEGPLEFRLRYDRAATPGPFTGRVHVLLLKTPTTDLKGGLNWFDPEPLFAKDVVGWKPGETLVIGAEALNHKGPLAKLAPGTYSIQAVMDLNPDHISFSTAPGNVYAKTIRRDLDPARSGPVELVLDQVVQPRKFVETPRVKLVELESRLLTAFHGRPTFLRAGVVLPPSWAKEPTRRYPIVYEIPGFSGTHEMAHGRARADTPGEITKAGAGTEFLWAVLDPSCHHGHHVFADSANNGPVGRALVEEFIPHLEKEVRALGRPEARFVTGHSSGGWSSLWLQVNHPDVFGGCWSTAPDPVDFRDFQRVNIYRPGENLFTDAAGQPRPLGRRGGKVIIWYKPFSDMEAVMGHGGQLRSFEAVFSGRGKDGAPRPLWDRRTGAIDPAVAKSWEKYDIRQKLEREWPTTGPRLAGKIHVYMGEDDNFYLEGATRLLQASARSLKAPSRTQLSGPAALPVVELFPGKDHGSLMDRPMRERISREMAAAFRAGSGPAAKSGPGVKTER